jgi:hypothetical protein
VSQRLEEQFGTILAADGDENSAPQPSVVPLRS